MYSIWKERKYSKIGRRKKLWWNGNIENKYKHNGNVETKYKQSNIKQTEAHNKNSECNTYLNNLFE